MSDIYEKFVFVYNTHTVTNLTVGGLLGYSSVNSMVSLNVPSSNGVSCGPKMTAFHIIMLLSVGAPLTPVGGSSCNLKNGHPD